MDTTASPPRHLLHGNRDKSLSSPYERIFSGRKNRDIKQDNRQIRHGVFCCHSRHKRISGIHQRSANHKTNTAKNHHMATGKRGYSRESSADRYKHKSKRAERERASPSRNLN